MTLNSENYTLASEPKSNLYGALYSVLATDDPSQRKSMHYIGCCIGRAAYLMDKAESFLRDKLRKRYNVFLAIASFLVATVCVECGKTLAWTAYGAVSLLSLLFVPDKEVALTFVFLLGYYPLVKPKFEHIRPALLRGLCKLLLCNGGILLMYGLVLLLIPGGSISQEMRTTALAVSLTTLAMGNVAFLLYDRALHNMLQAYRILWQPRLHKMLGR